MPLACAAHVQLDSPTSSSYLPSPAYLASTLLKHFPYARLSNRKGWTKRQKSSRTAVSFPPTFLDRLCAIQCSRTLVGKEEYHSSRPPQPPLTPEVILLFCQDDGHDRLYAGPFEESPSFLFSMVPWPTPLGRG